MLDRNINDSICSYSFVKIACKVTQYVGDGYCDDVSNTATCGYDGGDCCGDNVNTLFCFTCACHESSSTLFKFKSGILFNT